MIVFYFVIGIYADYVLKIKKLLLTRNSPQNVDNNCSVENIQSTAI